MVKFWDKVMKMLVHANPQDFVTLLSQETRYISDITNEQITRSIEADFLCKAIRNEQEVVVHAEFQRSGDAAMGQRMWEYNTITSYLTRLPVCSFALYLWKDNSIVAPPYELRLIDGKLIHIFYYDNIFLWEIPAEKLQQKGLEGLLPLLPLTKDAKNARDKIVGAMIDGLRAANKEGLLALGYALAGRVYTAKADQEWLQRRFHMLQDFLEESWSYQEMVREGTEKGMAKGMEQGLKQGLEQGLEQGELKALRQVLVNMVETRFPELLDLAQQQAEQVKIPELLSMVINKLFTTQTTEKARQVLTEISQVPDTPRSEA